MSWLLLKYNICLRKGYFLPGYDPMGHYYPVTWVTGNMKFIYTCTCHMSMDGPVEKLFHTLIVLSRYRWYPGYHGYKFCGTVPANKRFSRNLLFAGTVKKNLFFRLPNPRENKGCNKHFASLLCIIKLILFVPQDRRQ